MGKTHPLKTRTLGKATPTEDPIADMPRHCRSKAYIPRMHVDRVNCPTVHGLQRPDDDDDAHEHAHDDE